MNLVCIKCPRGCNLKIEGDSVQGNLCPKGEVYAKEELTCPMRTVTSLIKVNGKIVPVKTSQDIPKERIKDVLVEISKINISSSHVGMVLIKNVLGLGADIVVTGNACS